MGIKGNVGKMGPENGGKWRKMGGNDENWGEMGEIKV